MKVTKNISDNNISSNNNNNSNNYNNSNNINNPYQIEKGYLTNILKYQSDDGPEPQPHFVAAHQIEKQEDYR